MRTIFAIAAGLLLVLRGSAAAQSAPSAGMVLPVPAAQVASALGLTRSDTANLPLDLVRALYAAPEGISDAEAPVRAAVQHLLNQTGGQGDRLPLPLGSAIWRDRLLLENVPEQRLASAILGRRSTALLYHGLLALDEETLRWLALSPGALDHLRRRPAVTAVFARSLHIRNGAIVTPGEKADEVWAALVGAEPSQPESFIGHLLDARGGRLAFLFDTVMHLDAAHQRFALTAARGESRIARARALLGAVAESAPSWKIEERPFTRPDVDVSHLLRLVSLTEDAAIVGATSRGIWERAFDNRIDMSGDAADDVPIDAAWLAGKVLRASATTARQRLDMFLCAQRVLPDAAGAPPTAVLEALRGLARYPALMLTLDRNGVRGVLAYSAAARGAAAVEHDPDALALSQSLLAVIDRAQRASTLHADVAAPLYSSLLEVAASGRATGSSMAQWTSARLLPALRTAIAGNHRTPDDPETIVMRALAGPLTESPPTVEWEGRKYQVDVAAAEFRRIARVRKGQAEASLGPALAAASSAQGVRDLTQSLAALVYAVALGDPDGQALVGGAVWRRHRFKAEGPSSEATEWRIATESFGPGGWHLTGSLLALEAAVPRLALRRLDVTDIPQPARLSTSDRRTLSLTIALIEPSQLTNEDRDSITAALSTGRGRVRALSTDSASLASIVRDAALSEWRANGVAWLLASDPERVPSIFTITELYRLGRRTSHETAWGAAVAPLDGSLNLRLAAEPWEEYAGRPSTGQLGCQLADVLLLTAETLAEWRLPASLGRDVAAFAMQDVLDHARLGYFDDFLSVAFLARDLRRERFEDYVAALTASGQLTPVDTATDIDPHR